MLPGVRVVKMKMPGVRIEGPPEIGDQIVFEGHTWVVTQLRNNTQTIMVTNGLEERMFTQEFVMDQVTKIDSGSWASVQHSYGMHVLRQEQRTFLLQGAQASKVRDEFQAAWEQIAQRFEFQDPGFIQVEFGGAPDLSIDGWHVVWEETHVGDEIVEYGSAVRGDACDTVADCWAFVDYLNDDEVGTPRHIMLGKELVYTHGDGQWRRLDPDKPNVPEGY